MVDLRYVSNRFKAEKLRSADVDKVILRDRERQPQKFMHFCKHLPVGISAHCFRYHLNTCDLLHTRQNNMNSFYKDAEFSLMQKSQIVQNSSTHLFDPLHFQTHQYCFNGKYWLHHIFLLKTITNLGLGLGLGLKEHLLVHHNPASFALSTLRSNLFMPPIRLDAHHT